MSLDVYLTIPGTTAPSSGSGIFVRLGGATKEISREEWDKLFPGREPVVISPNQSSYVYSANITHNLNKMASECGLYEPLWNPPEGCKAKDLIDPIFKGLATLEADPTKYKKLNPPNGWGDYEGLVEFASNYLHACIKYPDAIVEISK